MYKKTITNRKQFVYSIKVTTYGYRVLSCYEPLGSEDKNIKNPHSIRLILSNGMGICLSHFQVYHFSLISNSSSAFFITTKKSLISCSSMAPKAQSRKVLVVLIFPG